MPQQDPSQRDGRGILGIVHGSLAILSVLCIAGVVLLYAWGKGAHEHDAGLGDVRPHLGITAIFGVLDVVVIA
jgi:hypothetical protein